MRRAGHRRGETPSPQRHRRAHRIRARAYRQERRTPGPLPSAAGRPEPTARRRPSRLNVKAWTGPGTPDRTTAGRPSSMSQTTTAPCVPTASNRPSPRNASAVTAGNGPTLSANCNAPPGSNPLIFGGIFASSGKTTSSVRARRRGRFGATASAATGSPRARRRPPIGGSTLVPDRPMACQAWACAHRRRDRSSASPTRFGQPDRAPPRRVP